MRTKAVIVSGYFNPLHKGHIDYFIKAKQFGEMLFVIINSDLQRKLKGSKEFQNEEERQLIIASLKIVDKCILSIDKDRTVNETLKLIHDEYSEKFDLCFANGGDQNNKTIPEKTICETLGIKLIDGLGDKIQSSSWLLNSN